MAGEKTDESTAEAISEDKVEDDFSESVETDVTQVEDDFSESVDTDVTQVDYAETTEILPETDSEVIQDYVEETMTACSLITYEDQCLTYGNYLSLKEGEVFFTGQEKIEVQDIEYSTCNSTSGSTICNAVVSSVIFNLTALCLNDSCLDYTEKLQFFEGEIITLALSKVNLKFKYIETRAAQTAEAVFSIERDPLTCAIPECENYFKTGRNYADGCPILACPTSSEPSERTAENLMTTSCPVLVCKIGEPQITGEDPANGCPEYVCPAINLKVAFDLNQSAANPEQDNLELKVQLLGTTEFEKYKLFIFEESVVEKYSKSHNFSLMPFDSSQVVSWQLPLEDEDGLLFMVRLYLIPAEIESLVCGKNIEDWRNTRPSCAISEYLIDVFSVLEEEAVIEKIKPSEESPIEVIETTEVRLVPPAGYEDEVITAFKIYENPFPDTEIVTIEGQSAAELYRRGVIGGFSDGEFKGENLVNRAEAAKFLLLARYGSVSDVQNNNSFPDVLDGQWYTKFVVTAANEDIISGYPDGYFRPANTVNTAEFLKMLNNTFDLPKNLPYTYTDVSSESWYAEFAGIAEQYELFPERESGLLKLEQELTRNEVAVAIYQYLKQK